jgi:uncharacterized protein YfaS (alpha-2-macroglobulin family)
VELQKAEKIKDDAGGEIQLEVADAIIEDERDLARTRVAADKKVMYVPNGYYRAREFSAPVYKEEDKIELRNDFRSTIYWNGNVETDRSGRAIVEFYNCDAISSFKATIEGFSADGMIGRAEKTFFTQLPFSMSVKAPIAVSTTISRCH